MFKLSLSCRISILISFLILFFLHVFLFEFLIFTYYNTTILQIWIYFYNFCVVFITFLIPVTCFVNITVVTYTSLNFSYYVILCILSLAWYLLYFLLNALCSSASFFLFDFFTPRLLQGFIFPQSLEFSFKQDLPDMYAGYEPTGNRMPIPDFNSTIWIFKVLEWLCKDCISRSRTYPSPSLKKYAPIHHYAILYR